MNREVEVASLLESAGAAMRKGRKCDAEADWARALEISPDHPIALNGLGMLALGDDQPSRAAAFFHRAAVRDPAATVLWLNHAKAARADGDLASERASLVRADELEPMSLLVNVRLGDNAEHMGNEEEAVARRRLVVLIADGMDKIPAEARAAVDHARAFVADQAVALGARIDAALSSTRENLAPTRRRRIDAAIDHMLGRRTFYINQCSGLHVPFLPADEYFDRDLFPWFSELEAATGDIRAELMGALDAGSEGFEPYVQLPPGTPRNVWTGLDGSSDWNTLHLWRHGKRNETACLRFPRTAAVIEALPLARLPKRMPTVFFSILAPHAHIPPHTGVTNARAIVHLPLLVPPGCRFRVGGETRSWNEGEAFAFDDTIEHEAWNDSDHARVVLILDTWNPYLRMDEQDLLVQFYGAEIGGRMEG